MALEILFYLILFYFKIFFKFYILICFKERNELGKIFPARMTETQNPETQNPETQNPALASYVGSWDPTVEPADTAFQGLQKDGLDVEVGFKTSFSDVRHGYPKAAA